MLRGERIAPPLSDAASWDPVRHSTSVGVAYRLNTHPVRNRISVGKKTLRNLSRLSFTAKPVFFSYLGRQRTKIVSRNRSVAAIRGTAEFSCGGGRPSPLSRRTIRQLHFFGGVRRGLRTYASSNSGRVLWNRGHKTMCCKTGVWKGPFTD